ncbi:MAG TPA: hypothetical protein VFA83_08465 [Acidimicrobiales bacterium]|nr:hypothetical protein [Acidimicrobiales bacterium]
MSDWEEVDERGRLRSVMQPTRRTLGRILRPYFAHQQTQVHRVEERIDAIDRRLPSVDELAAAVTELAEIQGQLAQALEALTAQVAGLAERQEEIDRKAAVVAAVTWDHVALTRRLAALEDVLTGEEAGAEAVPPSG